MSYPSRIALVIALLSASFFAAAKTGHFDRDPHR